MADKSVLACRCPVHAHADERASHSAQKDAPILADHTHGRGQAPPLEVSYPPPTKRPPTRDPREITQSVMLEPDQPQTRTSSDGEPGDRPDQPANRLILRICLSKTRAGTKRRRALTRPAVAPAG